MSIYKTILNPYTGKLQKVFNGSLVNFEAGVDTVGDLPDSGNSEGDARIANDTGHLYIWDGSAWQDQGDVIDLKWTSIENKPSSSVSDIDDAVAKKHSQNTDTKLDNGQVNEVTSVDLRGHLDSIDNPHIVTVDQLDLASGTVASDIDDAIDKKYYYVDRGDPSAYDFTKTDFTTDLGWHDLDLSSVVPEGAKLVHLKARLSCFDLAGLQFRKKGNTNSINVTTMKIQVANIFYYADFFLSCDSNRKIQYLSSNVTWGNLDITIRGWFTNND